MESTDDLLMETVVDAYKRPYNMRDLDELQPHRMWHSAFTSCSLHPIAK